MSGLFHNFPASLHQKKPKHTFQQLEHSWRWARAKGRAISPSGIFQLCSNYYEVTALLNRHWLSFYKKLIDFRFVQTQFCYISWFRTDHNFAFCTDYSPVDEWFLDLLTYSRFNHNSLNVFSKISAQSRLMFFLSSEAGPNNGFCRISIELRKYTILDDGQKKLSFFQPISSARNPCKAHNFNLCAFTNDVYTVR